MRWLRAVRVALASVALIWELTTGARASGSGAIPHVNVSFGVPIDRSFGGRARTLMEYAVAGARKRLATERCQMLFTDFFDRRGRPLTAALAEQRHTAAQQLDAIYFIEGNVTPQCLSGRRLAFTAPGSRVVFVCGQRFEPYLVQNEPGSEVVIIHELLHALGLGENPPPSAEISERVASRCPAVLEASEARAGTSAP